MAFRKTVAAMKSQLDREYECLRPTTPVGEDVFNTHNYLMKTRFIDALNVLRQSCEDSAVETNQRTASEIMRAQLGTRFALAADIDESRKSQNLAIAVGTSSIPPRGYAR
ncbi:MAG: hypothetical protein JO314_10480 [Acidobacteria bacterium]|nr:hypothetical protein [Acidobacteriota bacterium]